MSEGVLFDCVLSAKSFEISQKEEENLLRPSTPPILPSSLPVSSSSALFDASKDAVVRDTSPSTQLRAINGSERKEEKSKIHRGKSLATLPSSSSSSSLASNKARRSSCTSSSSLSSSSQSSSFVKDVARKEEKKESIDENVSHDPHQIACMNVNETNPIQPCTLSEAAVEGAIETKKEASPSIHNMKALHANRTNNNKLHRGKSLAILPSFSSSSPMVPKSSRRSSCTPSSSSPSPATNLAKEKAPSPPHDDQMNGSGIIDTSRVQSCAQVKEEGSASVDTYSCPFPTPISSPSSSSSMAATLPFPFVETAQDNMSSSPSSPMRVFDKNNINKESEKNSLHRGKSLAILPSSSTSPMVPKSSRRSSCTPSSSFPSPATSLAKDSILEEGSIGSASLLKDDNNPITSLASESEATRVGSSSPHKRRSLIVTYERQKEIYSERITESNKIIREAKKQIRRKSLLALQPIGLF